VFYCFIDAISVLPHPAHDLSTLIPYVLTIPASIKEVLFGFFLLLAKHTNGGFDEAPFSEIVPS
jgi:hypothetical protein